MPRRSHAQQEADEYEEWLAAAEERSDTIRSVVRALHSELDKLTKKWPAMPVTDMLLSRVNKAIRESHLLMDRDGEDFLAEIEEFVAAGDNPEGRDVVLILAELDAAIARFRSRHSADWRSY